MHLSKSNCQLIVTFIGSLKLKSLKLHLNETGTNNYDNNLLIRYKITTPFALNILDPTTTS